MQDPDEQHGLPERENRGEERNRRQQADVVRLATVRKLHRRHESEQHEGRAETDAGSWADRAATTRREIRHGYAQQHARSERFTAST
jgi:hypothetical protein